MSVAEPETEWPEDENGGGTGNDGGGGDSSGGSGGTSSRGLAHMGRLGGIAAASAMSVVFAVAAWYALQRPDLAAPSTVEVPLVRAEPGPVKEKPADPGGMKIPNQDKLVYERITPKAPIQDNQPPVTEKLAPAPEEPIVKLAAVPKEAPKEAPKPAPPPPIMAKPEAKEVTVEAVTALKPVEKPKPVAPPAAPIKTEAKSADIPKEMPKLVEKAVEVIKPLPKTAPKTAPETMPKKSVAPGAESLLPPAQVPIQPATATKPKDAALPTPKAAAATPVKPATTPAVAPAIEKSPVATVEKLAEKLAEKPAEKPADKPVVQNVQKPKVAAPKAAAPKTAVKKPAPAAPPKVTQAPPAKTTPVKAAKPGFRIQFAAYRTADKATAAWSKIRKTHAAIVSGLQPHTQRVDLGKKGIYFRVQAGNFKTAGAARLICGKLKAKRQDCIIVVPNK